MITKDILGARIRVARERKNLSQEELAQMVGKNQRVISEYETGRRRIFFDDVVRFAAALEVSLDYFVTGETDQELDDQLLSEFHALNTEMQAVALDQIRVLRRYATKSDKK